MKIAAVLAVEMVVAVLATAGGVNGLAEEVVLLAAAGAGLFWFWRHLLRPAAKLLKRTVSAVDAFERLPGWQQETDERLAALEHEVVHVLNGNKAIIRELGIEDKVRRVDPRSWGVEPTEISATDLRDEAT